MLLVVGLGNPGRRYARHRHNVGYMVVDALAEEHGAASFQTRFAGEIARVRLADEEALLLKPTTFMNQSGRSVQPAAAFFKIPVDDVVVVHDELDLPFGTVRLKKGGGHAGHNGLRSLIAHLGGPAFCRVRIGIGRPPADFRGEVADYVLAPFPEDQRPQLPTSLETAAQSVLDIAARGMDAAMRVRNTKPKRKPSSDESDGSDEQPAQPESK